MRLPRNISPQRSVEAVIYKFSGQEIWIKFIDIYYNAPVYFKFDTPMLQKLYADFQSYLFQPRGDNEHAAPQESTRVVNNYIQF